MELRDSKKFISYFSRIALQLPTIALSTVTMIAISRNLGPSGRGEVSQFLLLASIVSSIICTPIFLNIMHLKNASEIKTYVLSSLFLFNRRNLILVGIFDAFLLLLEITNRQVLSIENIIYLNLLIIFYFIASQIRDLLIRFNKNKIYGIDFATQIIIFGSILGTLFFHSLSPSYVIQLFVITYGILAFLLLVILKSRVKEFEYINLVRSGIDSLGHTTPQKTKKIFSKLGILFQISMSKDLLIGVIFLSKADFGLMSAMASFWVVIRFLRPSAVIQAKLGTDETVVSSGSPRIFTFFSRPNSAIYIQVTSIALIGLLSYLLTPILMGKGFKPNIAIVIAGTTSEILLMKCLYDLSTNTSEFSQNLLMYLMTLQVVFLIFIGFAGIKLTIALIWISSCMAYLVWQVINLARSRK